MKHGFIKVAAAIPEVKVADCEFNAEKIEKMIKQAAVQGVEAVCFPELSLTSYSCGDLFFQELLLGAAKKYLLRLIANTAHLDIVAIVGLPLRYGDKIFNVAAIFSRGDILGFVPKTYLPNYGEYYEKRWFASSKDLCVNEIEIFGCRCPFTPNLVVGSGAKFAVEICEDLWTPVPPSCFHSLAGAHLIFNLSASNELVGKHKYRKSLVEQQSARCIAGYVYAGAGFGESSTDLVFSGNALICENGVLLSEAERFSFDGQLVIADIDIDRLTSQRRKNTSFDCQVGNNYSFINTYFKEKETPLHRYINPQPFVPAHEDCETLNEIFSIQTGGLAKRLTHTGINRTVIGVSGGLDSALALLVCIKTCDKLKLPRQNVIGVTMPGFGTTGRTLKNAETLMQELGITVRNISIVEACERHFKDIGHDPETHDITYENTQARERTQILMDIANQCGGLVVGTGDMSELALGWATYGGDHISMYGVNSGVPKTLVKRLVEHVAETQIEQSAAKILKDIIDTPVSPELLPAKDGKISQATETIVGPYELHDFFLFYILRDAFSPSKIYYLSKIAFKGIYDDQTILHWMRIFYRRFFAQQFKRSCMPDGPKVGAINLSPRGDWRMPSDASCNLWLKEMENLL
ncbi:MAG: NAD(+) synthase [Prevotellaceae bacterium]|jgi:NAD+ synthase (glutamine-hydrolysing)|nr:NAD(+) synthase [Prevotellaceae bacterium]